MFKVSGISGKNEIEEDEEGAEVSVAETSRKALTEVLGAERRDRILSALYMARQDAVHVVRQASIHIWKALVHNTPRTGTSNSHPFVNYQLTIVPVLVREILPELVTQIMLLLSSGEGEQEEVWPFCLRVSDKSN